MTALARYEAAHRALAEASDLGEVLGLRDKAQALAACARIAGDRSLEIMAAELRLRAERRVGELMAARRDERAPPGRRPARQNPGETGSGGTRYLPTLAEAGIGKKLADRARLYAALPAPDFEARLAERRAAIEAGRARVPLDLVAPDKTARRAEREAVLGERIAALPRRRYGVILADPEWRFEPRSRVTGMDRAADNHYPTSKLSAICARDVASIAAPDCLLAMWATVPMLAEAFCVLDAWGFARFERDPESGFLTLEKSDGRYVSSTAWVKYGPGAGIGLGHWFRVDHEILLVATRGQVPAPAQGTQPRSVLDAPASEIHSQKPELVAEMLESWFPSLPKIELNRRGPARPGWDAWGQEAEPEAVVDETPAVAA